MPTKKKMGNGAPFLKRKEKQTQKVTLMHPSSKFQTYKLNINILKGS
jgi:hypothetical protein